MSIAIVRATNHACIRGSRPTSRPQPLSYYKADKRISELNKNFHAKTNRIKFLSWCLPQAHGFQTQVVNFEYFYSYHSCSYSSCRTVELNHRQRQDGSNSKGNATSALCVSQQGKTPQLLTSAKACRRPSPNSQSLECCHSILVWYKADTPRGGCLLARSLATAARSHPMFYCCVLSS